MKCRARWRNLFSASSSTTILTRRESRQDFFGRFSWCRPTPLGDARAITAQQNQGATNWIDQFGAQSRSQDSNKSRSFKVVRKSNSACAAGKVALGLFCYQIILVLFSIGTVVPVGSAGCFRTRRCRCDTTSVCFLMQIRRCRPKAFHAFPYKFTGRIRPYVSWLACALVFPTGSSLRRLVHNMCPRSGPRWACVFHTASCEPQRSCFTLASGYEDFVLYCSLAVPRHFGMGALLWGEQLSRWIGASQRRSRFLSYCWSARRWVRAARSFLRRGRFIARWIQTLPQRWVRCSWCGGVSAKFDFAVVTCTFKVSSTCERAPGSSGSEGDDDDPSVWCQRRVGGTRSCSFNTRLMYWVSFEGIDKVHVRSKSVVGGADDTPVVVPTRGWLEGIRR